MSTTYRLPFATGGGSGGGAPSGNAGGVLSGTYPNPDLTANLTPYPIKFGASPAAAGLVRFSTGTQTFAKGVISGPTDVTLFSQSGDIFQYGSTAFSSTYSGDTCKILGGSEISLQCALTKFYDSGGNLSLTVTPVYNGTTVLTYAVGVTAAKIVQTDNSTNSATASPMTIQAQNATGTSATGGALNLTSGTGTGTNGAVNLQVGGTTTASCVTNKFVFSKGFRAAPSLQTGSYNVAVTDYWVQFTISSAASCLLPSGPTAGDTYRVSCATLGGATLTVNGNGTNIVVPGGSTTAATVAVTADYTCLELAYNGSIWALV